MSLFTASVVGVIAAMIGAHGEPAPCSAARPLALESAVQGELVPLRQCSPSIVNLELFDEVEDEKRTIRFRDLPRSDLTRKWSLCRSASVSAPDRILAPAPLANLHTSGIRWQV